jgi:hypothetical protein
MKKLFISMLLLQAIASFGQVTITKPSLSFTACSYPSSYVALGNLRFDETTNADIAAGNGQTIVISAPANFEFEPGVGSIDILTGRNIRSNNLVLNVTASTITATFDCDGTNKLDIFQISGLRVRVTSAASTSFTRSGGTASISGLAIGTALTNTISGQSLPENTYRTVTNATGNLSWNASSTWECGSIPPNNGLANVVISAFNGTYSHLNAVIFNNSTVNSVLIETGANFSAPGNSGTTFIVNDDFTIQSGAYFLQYNWASSGKNAIQIKGDFVNNGEMTTTGSNNTYDLDITFNGSSPQTISGTGVFRMISNGSQMSTLTFDNAKGITLNANFSTNGVHGDAGAVVVNGLLSFGSSTNQFTGSGSLTMNGHTVLKASSFYGHYAMTGTRTLGANATVEYTNTSSSISSANIPTLNLYRLVAAVGTSGTITVGGNLSVSNLLTMTSGKINLGANILTIGTSTSNTGLLNYADGFIIGKVKRWFTSTNTGNESGLFPLGIGTKKKQIKVEYTQATDGGTITAEWINSAMGSNFTADPITTSCNGSFEIYNTASGYWSMTPGDGITNNENKTYNITLQAQGLLDFTDDCHVTALKRQGSNPWLQSGTHVDNLGDAISPNVQRVGATGWSNWGFAGGSGTPLPVELTSFNVVCEEGNSSLAWTTASEFNSQSFNVELSRDGYLWETVGTLQAAGYSNENVTYQFSNAKLASHKYARLLQVDVDGQSKQYGPIEITCAAELSMSTVPNPSENTFNVIIRSNETTSKGNLIVRDIAGQLISTSDVEILNGINLFPIHNAKLTSGTYIIEFRSLHQMPLIERHIVK